MLDHRTNPPSNNPHFLWTASRFANPSLSLYWPNIRCKNQQPTHSTVYTMLSPLKFQGYPTYWFATNSEGWSNQENAFSRELGGKEEFFLFWPCEQNCSGRIESWSWQLRIRRGNQIQHKNQNRGEAYRCGAGREEERLIEWAAEELGMGLQRRVTRPYPFNFLLSHFRGRPPNSDRATWHNANLKAASFHLWNGAIFAWILQELELIRVKLSVLKRSPNRIQIYTHHK